MYSQNRILFAPRWAKQYRLSISCFLVCLFCFTQQGVSQIEVDDVYGINQEDTTGSNNRIQFEDFDQQAPAFKIVQNRIVTNTETISNKTQIELRSFEGQLISRQAPNSNTGISLAGLPTGFYLIIIYSPSGERRHKIWHEASR